MPAWVHLVDGIIPREKPSAWLRADFKIAGTGGFVGDTNGGLIAGVGSERLGWQCWQRAEDDS